MTVIGMRVTPQKIYYVILSVEIDSINVKSISNLIIPTAIDTPEKLKYIRNTLLDILREYKIERAGIRITESSSKNISIPRIQIEGVLLEMFASSCLKDFYVGQISNITKRLGIQKTNFKLYVNNEMEYPGVENWGDLKIEEREALLTALGAIK